MNGREDGAQHSSFRTLLTLMAIPLAGLAIFFLWQWLNGGVTPRDVADEAKLLGRGPARPAPARVTPAVAGESALPAVTPKKKRRQRGGDIVLIIDDLGFEGQPPGTGSVQAFRCQPALRPAQQAGEQAV